MAAVIAAAAATAAVFFLACRLLFPPKQKKHQLVADPLAAGRPGNDVRVRGELCRRLVGTCLACPACRSPFIGGTSEWGTTGSALKCETCKKSYANNGKYFDLLTPSDSEGDAERETTPEQTQLFRGRLMSFIYERGWRQSFKLWSNNPGPKREFEMAKDYFKSTFGGTLLDASCGSGLFSRMFCRSGLYDLIIALDLSKNMLLQCSDFSEREGVLKDLVLVQADISKLPFASNSIDAVHAGAALHCWPSPSAAVTEICRVLRPGGVFVGTTFVSNTYYSLNPLMNMTWIVNKFTNMYFYKSEDELEDIFKSSGLIHFTCVRKGIFVMITATKPS